MKAKLAKAKRGEALPNAWARPVQAQAELELKQQQWLRYFPFFRPRCSSLFVVVMAKTNPEIKYNKIEDRGGE